MWQMTGIHGYRDKVLPLDDDDEIENEFQSRKYNIDNISDLLLNNIACILIY